MIITTTPQFDIFGTLPKLWAAEQNQYHRVLAEIEEMVGTILEFAVLAVRPRYRFPEPSDQQSPDKWTGRFDAVLFAPDRILTLHLKPRPVVVLYGRSDEQKWKIVRHGRRRLVQSWFIEASRQRHYLLRTFLSRAKEAINIPDSNHFVVDSRVICGDGSDFSGFRHNAPTTTTSSELERICRSIPATEAEFLRSVYTKPVLETGELRFNRSLSQFERSRVISAYGLANYPIKTARWFGLTEERVLKDEVSRIRSDRFRLDRRTAQRLARQLVDA